MVATTKALLTISRAILSSFAVGRRATTTTIPRRTLAAARRGGKSCGVGCFMSTTSNNHTTAEKNEESSSSSSSSTCLLWEVRSSDDDGSSSRETGGGLHATLRLLSTSSHEEDEDGSKRITNDENDGHHDASPSIRTVTEGQATTIDNNDGHGRDEEAIPESVLQFERQQRKLQHAKKVGKAVRPQDLDVVYLDDDLVIVNKPPGVLTVPGVNNHTSSLLDVVYNKFAHKHLLQQKSQMIVHRLDMDTSGLVVFARKQSVAKILHAMFRGDYYDDDDNQNNGKKGRRRRSKNKQQQNSSNGVVEKEYQALVVGDFASSSIPPHSSDDNNNNKNGSNIVTITHGLIDLPLQRDHEHFPFMRVSTPSSERAAASTIHGLQRAGYKKLLRKNPKPSQTKFQVVSRRRILVDDDDENDDESELVYTHLRLTPLTGRTHQLRVHCAAAGYSIIGDPTYSLYGEAAPQGGLLATAAAIMIPPTTTKAAALFRKRQEEASAGEQQQQQSRPPPPIDNKDKGNNNNNVDHNNHEDSTTIISSSSPPSCCPLDLQKAWTKFYPPNQDDCPMCLHASKLSFPHPTIANQRVQVHVPAPFERPDYFSSSRRSNSRPVLVVDEEQQQPSANIHAALLD